MTGSLSAFSGTQKTRTPSGASASGFSLIELMVAMAMACIVLAAVYSLHAALTKSYTTQNAAADAQEAMRAAFDLMAEDLMMAGFDPMATGLFGILSADPISIRFTSDRCTMRNPPDAINCEDGKLDPGMLTLEDICYLWDGTQLIQRIDGDNTTDSVLVDNVTSLKFTYYKGGVAPAELVATFPATALDAAQLADIRTIKISMTVQAPAGRDKKVERTYATQFRVRNLDL
ncbi:MAG TPA: prepilin-type N-terminal cleavage/methylation domain-containing protein [Desulfobacterales bacterium]|nr:prepilin-type N-terminal cleavage/methylation domain-containing protein [Desulfobacterales bacterium]